MDAPIATLIAKGFIKGYIDACEEDAAKQKEKSKGCDAEVPRGGE